MTRANIRPINVMDGKTLLHIEDDETGEMLFSIPKKHRAYADLLWSATHAPGPSKLLALAQDYRRAVEYYISVDEKKGDDEGANLKRMTLSRIDEIIDETS